MRTQSEIDEVIQSLELIGKFEHLPENASLLYYLYLYGLTNEEQGEIYSRAIAEVRACLDYLSETFPWLNPHGPMAALPVQTRTKNNILFGAWIGAMLALLVVILLGIALGSF